MSLFVQCFACKDTARYHKVPVRLTSYPRGTTYQHPSWMLVMTAHLLQPLHALPTRLLVVPLDRYPAHVPPLLAAALILPDEMPGAQRGFHPPETLVAPPAVPFCTTTRRVSAGMKPPVRESATRALATLSQRATTRTCRCTCSRSARIRHNSSAAPAVRLPLRIHTKNETAARFSLYLALYSRSW